MTLELALVSVGAACLILAVRIATVLARRWWWWK